MTYYKATRPDGRDFHTGAVDYAAALASGETLRHPAKVDGRRNYDDPADYFSVATVPTDCTGMRWPCRLFVVEPVGRVWTPNPEDLPNKRACRALKVVAEVAAVEALGPQGAQLVELIEQAARLTLTQARDLDAAYAALVAAWDASRVAARNAALVLTVRDLISTEHYDTLTRSWRTVVGPLHPDDAPLERVS